jgi:hypothetical protein
MVRLRLLGLAGALVVAGLAVGAIAGAALHYAGDGFRVVSSGVTFGLVALTALAVVVLGASAARTLESTYW